jgi:hypothetical protein
MDMTTAFVNQFCHQVALMIRRHHEMRGWYNFGDKRPGTPVERLQMDADDHAEYQKMFKP